MSWPNVVGRFGLLSAPLFWKANDKELKAAAQLNRDTPRKHFIFEEKSAAWAFLDNFCLFLWLDCVCILYYSHDVIIVTEDMLTGQSNLAYLCRYIHEETFIQSNIYLLINPVWFFHSVIIPVEFDNPSWNMVFSRLHFFYILRLCRHSRVGASLTPPDSSHFEPEQATLS